MPNIKMVHIRGSLKKLSAALSRSNPLPRTNGWR
jgi:hypothetical protein